MAKETKYRPATMAEIEDRDTDLYMNGERVWVFMINRSQTIGEDDAKLIDIVLTNMKHVQPEDLQVIDDTLEEQDELPESPLMRYYGDLKSKHKDAILLFRCGDFYETYYEDAYTVSKLLGITLTRRGGNGYYMAGFPHHALDTYLPRIIRAGHRVAICDGPTPDDDPKGRKSETKETTSETTISNNSKSETTMAKNVNAQDYVGKVLVLSDGKSKYVIKSVDGDKLAAEFSRGEGAGANVSLTVAQVESMISAGKAQWSDGEPDPEAVGELVYDTTSATVEEVEEVSAITPTKPAVIEAINKAATEGKATTMPLGSHGTLIIASGGGEKPKPTKPTNPTGEKLSEVRLVVYTTARTQQQAPRIEGFTGEDDPRWKKHYDEKQRLKGLKADAEKNNDRLRKAMKGKTKAEKEAMMAQWVVVPNDPFNASYFTDRTTGEKTYSLVMGAKYLDVAQQLVDAYNTADRELWAKAEQAVAEVKSSVVAEAVAERQAKREERQAKREAEKGKTEQPTPETKAVQGYSDKDVAEMLKRIMAGEAIPENIKLAMAA